MADTPKPPEPAAGGGAAGRGGVLGDEVRGQVEVEVGDEHF